MLISAHVLTHNSERSLHATLASLKNFQEVIVIDTGSTDHSLAIARSFPNVKVHLYPLQGFGAMHNLAASLASYDWIFSIDSDEIASPSLIKELATLALDPCVLYSVERHNYYNGKRIKCCAGWYPDWVVRLYNRKTARFTEELIHEKVDVQQCRMIRLKGHLCHTPYVSADDFLRKMQSYSSWFAKQYQGKKRSSLGQAILRAGLAFLKNFFLKRGFLGGKEGLIISLYNTQTTYYKYLKLAEANRASTT